MQSEEHPEGLLTKTEEEYCGCLVLKTAELKALFVQDEEHWTEVQARVKAQADKVKGELRALIEKVRGEMNKVLENVPAEPKQLYALKKLQVFGYKMSDSEIEFCWP